MDSKRLNLGSNKNAAFINQLSSNDFSKLSELVYERFMNICGNHPVAFTSDITLSLTDYCHVDGDELYELQRSSLINSDKDSFTHSIEFLLKLLAEITKSNIKAKTLKNHLIEAGWQNDKIDIFINLWKSRSPEIIAILKNKSFDFSSIILNNIDRKIKILSDHSCESKQKLPLAEINFKFNDNKFDSITNEKHLTLNFTHSELLKFYDQIEAIQNKIDKLYN